MPDSRTPRRFARVISPMNAIDKRTLCGLSEGSADVMANTPATTETETVST